MHPSMASAARMAFVATGALPSAGTSLFTMATRLLADQLTRCMPVKHHKPDRFMTVQFTKLLGNQPAPIQSGSITGRMSVETTNVPESETRQSEPDGMVMLAPRSVSSAPFVAA